MEQYSTEIINDLIAGFLDNSTKIIYSYKRNDYRPHIITNNSETNTKVLSTFLSELNNCNGFYFATAFVTKGGIIALTNTLNELEKKNIKGKILISQYLNFSEPSAMRMLLKFKNIETKIAVKGNLHAKGYIFKKDEDDYSLIIGSSNLTIQALGLNKEWNLKISAKENSKLIFDTKELFEREFTIAQPITEEYIKEYEFFYNQRIEQLNNKIIYSTNLPMFKPTPNKMQEEALKNLKLLREQNKNKALLISATGTGKTYLAAFDAKAFNAKKLLFIIHRETIAKKSMETFQTIFGNTRTYGFYNGTNKCYDADFIFASNYTLAKEEYLLNFTPYYFDYIIIDESHHAGANTYQKILSYFKPKFLLGMTATPERNDGNDIFSYFDHNIAYEIRLKQAMEEDMLIPFQYFGITDISVDGKPIDEKSNFSHLCANERIKNISEKIDFYGTDNGIVRGIVFCSRIDECKKLAEEFNKIGKYKSKAIWGETSQQERDEAIRLLESDNKEEQLNLIFTVDIFNEGIDIPNINLIVMLRATESAIIFVQQLGRGLRKAPNKQYTTILDFIGNYQNNFLIPVALYGSYSYNKDELRRVLTSGSDLIPGASTINFDKIIRDRIFESINKANMQLRKNLIDDYLLLKHKLGRIPLMLDFIKFGSRDPQLYVSKYKSLRNFIISVEKDYSDGISKKGELIINFTSLYIANYKRITEIEILKEILDKNEVSFKRINEILLAEYGFEIDLKTFESSINNLNFLFVTENYNKKKTEIGKIYNLNIVDYNALKKIVLIGETLKQELKSEIFRMYLLDLINYSINRYKHTFSLKKYVDGFLLYEKYSREDVFRILNWKVNPVALNVGGYLVSSDKSSCPIFATYNKRDDISDTTKYEDEFLDQSHFVYFSKSKRTLESSDVKAIISGEIRLPLFVQKNNDEGISFYYLGDMTLIKWQQESLIDSSGVAHPIVRFIGRLHNRIEDNLYNYLIS